jgi:hypothetical protein
MNYDYIIIYILYWRKIFFKTTWFGNLDGGLSGKIIELDVKLSGKPCLIIGVYPLHFSTKGYGTPIRSIGFPFGT